MQRILTEEEYEALINQGQAERIRLKKVLQDLCIQVANHMPVSRSYSPESAPSPWGCILTNHQMEYCDHCPAKDSCPNDHKEWSK